MSVKFSIVPRKNPSKIAEPAKYYAQAQGFGEMDFDSLCEEVDGRCTATKADVTAALNGVLVCMKASLGKGEIVRLGDFGTFQIALSSSGAATEKEFNSSMIKKARISFRPGKLLTNLLKTLAYSQVAKLPAKEPAIEPEG